MREVEADIRVDPAWRGWVREVLEQVRFRPDHKAIQKELTAHLEDARADLERLGYPRNLAKERALQAMGDAKTVGQALDRTHKPWLGWLWQASRFLAGLALAAFLLTGWFAVWSRQLPDVGEWLGLGKAPGQEEAHPGGQFLDCPPPFQAGAYTIQVMKARYSQDPETGRAGLDIDLTSYTPEFWLEGPALGGYLEGVDSNGREYSWYQFPYVSGSGPNDGHLRNTMWINVYGIEGAPAWIDIRHRTAGWFFRLELPQGEEGTL